jgi:hypothetical protein
MLRKYAVFTLVVLMTAAMGVSVSAQGQARAVPGTPVITSPADGTTTTTNAPLLQWTGDVANTTSFKVVIKDAAGTTVYKNGGIDPAQACTGDACSFSFGAENVTLGNGSFTWKVSAKNAEGKAKSLAATFTVNFPGTPELIAPAEGSSSANTVPTFNWNVVNQADQYRVKVKNTVTGATFKSDWQAASAVCASTCSYTFAAAFAAGTYKWSVDAGQVTFPTSISKSVKWTFTIEAAR